MASDWWNNPKPGDVEKAERLLDEEFPPDYQPVLPARFTCEVHDVSGSCTIPTMSTTRQVVVSLRLDPTTRSSTIQNTEPYSLSHSFQPSTDY
jgi:hypothetical protein